MRGNKSSYLYTILHAQAKEHQALNKQCEWWEVSKKQKRIGGRAKKVMSELLWNDSEFKEVFND